MLYYITKNENEKNFIQIDNNNKNYSNFGHFLLYSSILLFYD
jgi:hypothetical protein